MAAQGGLQRRDPGRWAFYVLLAAAGAVVFLWKVRIAWPIRMVGLVDPAAYADMALSVLRGRGFSVDYVSMHFLRFPPGVTHPEETWPPLYALLIAPCFLLLGKSAFAAKLPSLLLSCFALPPLTAALGERVSRSRTVAFAAGVTVLLYVPLFKWSLYAIADITFGVLVTAAVWFALRGRRDGRWFLPMGAALAAAYYAKGSTVVVAPAFAAYHLLHRWGIPPAERRRADRAFALGFGLFVVLLLPWFVRNTVHYGDPLYCTHQHVAGYVGWKPWEENTYALYWHRRPPSPWDKWARPGELLRRSWRYALRQVRLLFFKMDDRIFLHPHLPLQPFTFRDVSTWLTGLPALAVTVLHLVAAAAGLRRRGRPSRPGLHRLDGAGLFFLVMLFLLSFLVLFWVPTSRYTTPVIPLVVILGWAGWRFAACRAVAVLRLPKGGAGGLVLLLLAFWASQEVGNLRQARDAEGYPWRDTGEAWIEMGAWIHEHLPGAVILTQYPWGVNFYSGEKAVQIPYGPPSDVAEVAAYYGAEYLLWDLDPKERKRRPAVDAWTRGRGPGLHPVHRVKQLVLFHIDPPVLRGTRSRGDGAR